MENLKIFFDHLYYWIICVAVGLIVLYVILSGVGEESAISNHLLVTGIICGVLCTGLALFFTNRTIKSRVQRPIIHTRRQY